MFKKLNIVFSVVMFIMTAVVSQAIAEVCLPAKGEISNNAQINGTTLGVVSMKLGGKRYNCVLLGVYQPQGPVNFRDTIICKTKVSGDEPFAQVTLNTRFLNPPLAEACPAGSASQVKFSFKEISTPDPLTARGDLTNVTDTGSIILTGDLNCAGRIQIKFSGKFCFSN